MPKFGRKVPHLWCDSHTSFKVKRSKFKVTRPINAYTHCVPYLPNGKAYELQTWCMDGGRRPASATRAVTSKVKCQGCKVTWSVSAVLDQCCTCVIRGRWQHTVSAEPDDHPSCYDYYYAGAAMWLLHLAFVLCLSFVSLSVCPSVSRITHECVNVHRPNMVGVGKGWPSRSDCILVLIQIRVWILDHFSISLTIAE